MEQLFAWKAELPECIMLVQVGDFFEAWGADAVMLVQWGALNPMARKPRAGFPATAASLQQALDNLTGADLSVAVVVQTGRPGQPNQPREIKQVVTPGAPTYLFGHELKLGCDGAGDLFSEGRPYVALRFRVDGLLYAELSPFRREVRYREHVTPEGVEALLAEHESIASPVILDGHTGAFKTAGRCAGRGCFGASSPCRLPSTSPPRIHPRFTPEFIPKIIVVFTASNCQNIHPSVLHRVHADIDLRVSLNQFKTARRCCVDVYIYVYICYVSMYLCI